MVQLHAELDRDVTRERPRCEASGRCCRFGEYGHTLFLTDIEAEVLFRPGIPDHLSSVELLDRCPYQMNGLCQARDRRPMGCRVYFCDPSYQDRQQELSEEYIVKLKRLYDDWNRPWNYRPLHWFLAQRLESQAGAGTLSSDAGGGKSA